MCVSPPKLDFIGVSHVRAGILWQQSLVPLAGSGFRSGAGGMHSGARMGWWHCKWWLNLLCHNTSPNDIFCPNSYSLCGIALYLLCEHVKKEGWMKKRMFQENCQKQVARAPSLLWTGRM